MAVTGLELREQQQRQADCVNAAILAGLKAGGLSLGVAGGLTAALQHYSPFFRSHFTVGAKSSIVALPVFYCFWHAAEKAIASCSRENSGNNRFMQPRGYRPPPRPDSGAEQQAAAAGGEAARHAGS